MPSIKLYTTNYCPYCRAAKALLKSKQVPFEEINVEDDPEKRDWLAQVTRQRTVPQIFVNGQPIGGFEELKQLDQTGELDRLLAKSS